jgi:hypothetical protein
MSNDPNDPNNQSQRPPDPQNQNPSGQQPYQQPYQQWQQPPPGYQQPPPGYQQPPPGYQQGQPPAPYNQYSQQNQADTGSNSGVWGWVIFILIFGVGNLILYSTTGWFIIPIPRR